MLKTRRKQNIERLYKSKNNDSKIRFLYKIVVFTTDQQTKNLFYRGSLKVFKQTQYKKQNHNGARE
ncbi:hypothetical protein QMN03_04470 [Leptospira santarosai]|uniref:hypothetical protein n=1 Tax=Leptospira santarosai TaxID=28183 RepID=UPI0024AEFDF3|nr:hypothetical protein [Leptospira santarosai]MDI7205748.1 hypothetical protein [Leptospira santarosai]MDI7206163.1 hypothetical protein [Leptospira santarosai]